jgi:inorganic pyrophosphatase
LAGVPKKAWTVSTNLARLTAFDDDNALRVVVESPRGSTLKLEYDPDQRLFTVSRSLPLGLAYPFDWGFVPGTIAADGDPVDALAIHQVSSYPGVVLPCRVLGMVELDEKTGSGKTRVNNRIIAIPAWHESLNALTEARDLPISIRDELEHFFIAATAFTGKKISVRGWAGSRATRRFIKSCQVRPGASDDANDARARGKK